MTASEKVESIDYNAIYEHANEVKNDGGHEAYEVFQSMQDDWVKLVTECCNRGRLEKWEKFYVHIMICKDATSGQIIRWVPCVRRTRPSPYQFWDSVLYKWDDKCGLTHEWSVPRPEVATYVANHPEMFDPSYVHMMQKFCNETLV